MGSRKRNKNGNRRREERSPSRFSESEEFTASCARVKEAAEEKAKKEANMGGLYKSDQPLIIVLGCQTTLVQLGFGEVYTPPRHRLPTRMFPGLKPRTFEPVKIVKKKASINGNANGNGGEGEDSFEEDPTSEEGAIYPIQNGRCVNAICLMAFLKHIHNLISPPFNTPVQIVTQPAFTDFEYELLTKYCFQQWTVPAFTLVDAAVAAQYAWNPPTCVIVDVGYTKTDITAIDDFSIIHIGRAIALPDTGGEAMTQRLLELLGPKGFTRDMCEQLKRSPICEVLGFGVHLPSEKGSSDNTTSAISGASGSTQGPLGQRASISGQGGAHGGMGSSARNEDEVKDKEENEGVLDVASIVASGKTNEFLAKRDREKAEKAAAKKAAAEAAAAPKQSKLQNAERVKATFFYDVSSTEGATHVAAVQGGTSDQTSPTNASAPQLGSKGKDRAGVEPGTVRKSIEVGIERFQAADNGLLDRIADAVHLVIGAAPQHARADLWNNLVITGNGTRIKGFKDALHDHIILKYLISPSSGTIFTSELPSALNTPPATGANTPNPLAPHNNNNNSSSTSSSHPTVNPMLHAATTGAAAAVSGTNLAVPSAPPPRAAPRTGHGQTPMSIRLAEAPSYFSEFKDVGTEELMFAGAQITAHLSFTSASMQGAEGRHMTRADYNAFGPRAVKTYSLL